jgi:kynureninase
MMDTIIDFKSPSLDLARQLDEQDALAAFRDEFVIEDPSMIYLDGNSLGRLPRRTAALLEETRRYEWGERLIRSWNEGWYDLPQHLGGKIARLIGAQPGEVVVCDATSINLFKLAAAAVKARPGRMKIVSDCFNFPSDLYILQGVASLMGVGYRLELIPSRDGIHIAQQDIEAAVDQDTALVCLSHVAFKSAFLYDMAQVTEIAHRAGALILWDLSHSAGALPVDLNGCQADLAVGCTYKYFNGGPGSPAFLYVRTDLQSKLQSPIWGWFGERHPFSFELDYQPTEGINRFLVGTPPVLSLRAIEPGLDLLLEAGMERLRFKSVGQAEFLIAQARGLLFPLGFTLGSPEQAARRGSHVSLCHPEAYRICRAMIEGELPASRVIPDFRAPDNIRLGIAPLYTRYQDVYRALDRIREIVLKAEYLRFPPDRLAVT